MAFHFRVVFRVLSLCAWGHGSLSWYFGVDVVCDPVSRFRFVRTKYARCDIPLFNRCRSPMIVRVPVCASVSSLNQ